jgi:sulfur-carrier protein adenylyltransferase/sulfurtransferase
MNELEITPEELVAMREKPEDFTLLDVRNPWEHSICAIEGDTLIPLHTLAARVHELDRGRKIVVYCHHGNRSMVAANFLRQAGFTAVSLAGGIDLWARRIDPATATY